MEQPGRRMESLTTRIWVDLPVVLEWPACQKHCPDRREKGCDDEGKPNVDANAITAAKTFLSGASVNYQSPDRTVISRRLTKPYRKSNVEHQHGQLERPHQGRVGCPASHLNLGPDYPRREASSWQPCAVRDSTVGTHLSLYSGSSTDSATRSASVMPLFARPRATLPTL